MSAILFRCYESWVLEIKQRDSYHIELRRVFYTAREAREFAKRKRVRVKRAACCDTLDN